MFMYYNIEKMRAEKQQQIERREKVRKVIDRILEYPISLMLLKAMSVLYLVILQPYVYQLVKDDLENSQINTIVSIVCVLILFIKNKEWEEKL